MATLDADDLAAITAIVDTRIDAVTAQLFAAIIEGANQVDGGGEVGAEDLTLAKCIRGIYAYCCNNATGLEGPTAIITSRAGGRNRAVFALANGNRSVTSRDES